MAEHWAGMIIRHVDGKDTRIAFRKDEDAANVVARIEEVLSTGVLILELDDRLMVIPLHSIKCIEMKPKPPKIPRYALRDVHLSPSRDPRRKP